MGDPTGSTKSGELSYCLLRFRNDVVVIDGMIGLNAALHIWHEDFRIR